MLVLGQRDLDSQNISLRVHAQGYLSAKPRNEVLADLLTSTKERRT